MNDSYDEHKSAMVRELDPYERSKFNTNLQEAVRRGDPWKITNLLRDKVSVRYLPGSSTPLHIATKLGHVECIQVLLSFGFDVNAPDHEGKTPLTLAIEHERDETIALLMEHGATTFSAQVVEPVRDDEMDALADCMTGMSNEKEGKSKVVTSVDVNHLLNNMQGVHLK
ncbi:MAG: ankyrin repeat-containing domain protein [Piptocephalis tieghemiana]|nr:MAG: ankyrin repeat-containing domain protein [Piptocephalis tieghemiana]